MAPKNTNSKEAGRARKAENEAKKKDAAVAEKERKEADSWADPGSKGAKRDAAKAEKEEKRREDAARKAEKARLLAEEEASIASEKKAAPKAGQQTKKVVSASRPAGPGAIAAGGGLASLPIEDKEKDSVKEKAKAAEEPESFTATGIDNALDLLDVVNAKMDKASIGQRAADIEKHPERRYKAAFEAYVERELPNIKAERPGLRLQQYKDVLHKQFQKAPENPFNQVTVSYDASKEEKLTALNERKAKIEERLRDRS